MKKGKRFGKSQVALAVMVVALAAAVWLNMRYSGVISDTEADTSSKYLGQAEYVNATVDGEKKEESDYFASLRKDRDSARDDALDIIDETLDRKDLSEEERASALEKSAQLAQAADKEGRIETVLKAKGFGKVVAVIGEKDINVIVGKDKLDTAQTAQIQDAVVTQTDFSVNDIKIITVDK